MYKKKKKKKTQALILWKVFKNFYDLGRYLAKYNFISFHKDKGM